MGPPPEEPEEEQPLLCGMGLGGTAIKPEGWDRTGMEAFQYMLYNPDTGEILTRTPLSWLKIFLFYCVYYAFLAGFWIASLYCFFSTLPEAVDGPRWTLDYSIIGVNPGVGLRPRNNDKLIDSQMFVLKAGDTNIFPSEREGEGELNSDYAVRMMNFLDVYENTTMGKTLAGQNYPVFDIKSQLGECGSFPYGYVGETVTPCIFLKLNNIWGWEPEPINCSKLPASPEEGEDDCPQSLRDHMASPQGIEGAGVSNVWVDCKGRYAADKEALADGGLQYFPSSRAIPMSSFPYEGKMSGVYHSALVALKVSPRSIGQLIHIECRAYYRGVVHSTRYKKGLVQFEVIVNEN